MTNRSWITGGVAAENTGWRSVFWMAVSLYHRLALSHAHRTNNLLLHVAWIVSKDCISVYLTRKRV